MSKRTGTIRVWAFAVLALAMGADQAQTSTTTSQSSPNALFCPDAGMWGSKIVTSVCWSCLFPMRWFGVQIGKGSTPSGATHQSLCECAGNGGVPNFGFTAGMWQPSRLVELVREPYCSPMMGGTVIRHSFRSWGMPDGSDGGSTSNQFYNYHYYAYPLLTILSLLNLPQCVADGYSSFDLMYLSELDPSWNEDELAMFTNPETAVAANPFMQAACVADCAGVTFGHPVDSLWWCAGCWGSLYPFTGNAPSGGSPPRVTSLLATRSIAALHRRGLARSTMGDDALCGGKIAPMLPKQQYKLSQLYPLAEANNNPITPSPGTQNPTGNSDLDSFSYSQGCCHYIGVPTMLWGEWRNIPAVGEDFIHMIWRWTDCCVY